MIRSSLAPYAGQMREPDPEAARRAARDAWHTGGLVLINPSWITHWPDRELLIALANTVHGPRPPNR